MKKLLTILLACQFGLALGQNDYYYEIPTNPDSYTGAHVAARAVDGLGFRYYWGTIDLRKEDLEWSPASGDKTRSTYATLEHIYSLSMMILSAVHSKPLSFRDLVIPTNYQDLRNKTLQNLEEASKMLKAPSANLETMKLIMKNGDRTNELPFWNILNGPIADALWHVGQVVSFRRSSGNPFPEGVSVLQGKKNK